MPKSCGFMLVVAGLVATGCNSAASNMNGAGQTQQGAGGAPAASPSATGPTNMAAPTASSGGGGVPGAGVLPMGGIVPAAPAIMGGSGGASAAPKGNAGAPSVSGPTVAGAAGAPAMDPPGTVTLTMDSFMLKADQEIYKCQNFDNPFGGKDTALQFISTDMSPGSHHLHVYHQSEGTSRTLEDCTISDFHPLLFAAGSPHAEVTYQTGMAAKLLGTAGLRIQVHYLNTSGKDLMVKAVLKLAPVDSASVTKWISDLYFTQLGLSVAPGAGQTVTTTCTIPSTYGPIGLVYGGIHMHKRGTRFTAKTGSGVMLADVTTWDEPPPIKYDPPIMLNPGDSITWTCEYNNDTGQTLMFGESAEKNEMCIYLARFYSAPDGAQLECQAFGPTGITTANSY
jgi:hypothetical protein